MKGYMYILECDDGSYYTGSTRYLEKRIKNHKSGTGANYTSKHLPVELVYVEEFTRVHLAFDREKQVQGWSHAKKKALINGDLNLLHKLSECQNDSHSKGAL
ncbi:MAG: GIY-YIG nuclease family protein [Flavobacteriales bacterium]|nr:GIY-YIG nuclease family protein [Flavobacteriales bacterium]